MNSITNNPLITKERLKAWAACADGYRWFLKEFPQGGEFSEVYTALQADKRYDDSGWLSDQVFAELDAKFVVRQTVLISGADTAKIEKSVADGAEAATTGYRANAATTGGGANAATTGYGANAATTGYMAHAATTGKHAVAAALGIEAKAKASEGGAIVLVHRTDSGDLLQIRASKVGENGIKPNVWYSLDESGVFVEVE